MDKIIFNDVIITGKPDTNVYMKVISPSSIIL